MSDLKALEKLLRSRIFWALNLPLSIASLLIILGQIFGRFPEFGLFSEHTARYTLFVGQLMSIPLFPGFLLVNFGFSLGTSYNSIFIGVSMFVYVIFILFLIKIKNLSKRTLYVAAIFFLLVALLATQGCYHEVITAYDFAP